MTENRCSCCGGALPRDPDAWDGYLTLGGDCPGRLAVDKYGQPVGCGAWEAVVYALEDHLEDHPDSSWVIRDPFAGELEVAGASLEEAIEVCYEDVPPEERPAYVWHGDERIDVPGGTCRPTF